MVKIFSDFHLNQVTTGHGIFPIFHNESFGKDDQCLSSENAGTKHIIKECYLQKYIRLKYFGKGYIDTSISDLLHHTRFTTGIRKITTAFYNQALGAFIYCTHIFL